MAAFYFKFIPGEYLKDTQNLSPNAQVAYDRIMCEHMRSYENHMKIICVSYANHKFFTKRLNDDEREELIMVLRDVGEGYQIKWVAEQIEKSRAYSESRSNNKKGKKKEKDENHMISYDNHMDSNSNSNNTEDNSKDKEGIREKKGRKKEITKKGIIFPSKKMESLWAIWSSYKRDEFKDVYKTDNAEQIAFNKFNELAGGDPVLGKELIDNAISNHWKGIFPIKSYGSATNKSGGSSVSSRTNQLAGFEFAYQSAKEAYNSLNNPISGVGGTKSAEDEIYGNSIY